MSLLNTFKTQSELSPAVLQTTMKKYKISHLFDIFFLFFFTANTHKWEKYKRKVRFYTIIERIIVLTFFSIATEDKKNVSKWASAEYEPQNGEKIEISSYIFICFV
jgi:predicted MPP superfamily phosphohydrolase